MSPPPSVSGAHCGAHPAVAAVEICSRCGTFLCGECVEYFKDITPCCAACLPLLKGPPPSPRLLVPPVLGFIALFIWLAGFLVPGRMGIALWTLSMPFGFSGLAFAVREVRLARAGTTSPRGKSIAWAGLIVCFAYVLLLALLVLGFVFFTTRQGGTVG